MARSAETIEEAAPDSMLAFSIAGHIFVSRGARKTSMRKLGNEEAARLCTGAAVPASLRQELQALAAEGMLWETQSIWSPWPGIEVTTDIVPVAEGHLRIHHVSSGLACEAYDCGFAVSGNYHALAQEDIDAVCQVLPLKCGGERLSIHAEANTNISHPESVIPAARYRIEEGISVLQTLVRTPAQQSCNS